MRCDTVMTRFPDKLLSARVFPDSQSQRPGVEPPSSSALMFPLPGNSVGRQDGSKPWTPGSGGGGAGPRGFGGAGGEMDEETKKNQNIINIVREGQISLLVSVTS